MKILIKLSGKVIDNVVELKNFCRSLRRKYKKDKIVIVHGGGKQVSEWMEKFGLTPRFIEGLRYTDKETLNIVISVLCGLVNKFLVATLIKHKIPAVGISCIDGKLLVTDIDKKLGFVGQKIKKVDPKVIDILLENNFVVVISSVGLGTENSKIEIVNINADNVVSAVAQKIKFDKFIFLTDVPGVMDSKKNIIKFLPSKKISQFINEGIITGGMIPKMKSVLDILSTGTDTVVITDNLSRKGTVIKR